MVFRVKHKNSPNPNRRPKPSDLDAGQIALNTNQESPGLYFRTDPIPGSDQEREVLVKVGPCHVGESAPTLENHTVRSIGEMWFNPVSQELRIVAEVTNNLGNLVLDWVKVNMISTRFRPPTSAAGLGPGELWWDGSALQITS